MAAFETTRDMRGAAQDPKRAKERYTKWARGTRPLAGTVNYNSWDADMTLTGSNVQGAKSRPQRTYEHHRIPSHNIVKPKIAHDVKQSHSRAKVDAMEELNDPAISRSLVDMLPSPNTRRKPSVTDGFLYSFDRTETPGKPLSLEIFVKSNPKETEKFVEKEYEILDFNGDALTGRKARRNLRQNHSSVNEPEILEDDGFELI